MENKKDLKRLNLVVGGRSYPVRIEPKEEAFVKQIETELNQKITDFQLSYKDKDKQDCVSMVLLSYAFELEKLKSNDVLNQAEQKLTSLEQILSEAL